MHSTRYGRRRGIPRSWPGMFQKRQAFPCAKGNASTNGRTAGNQKRRSKNSSNSNTSSNSNGAATTAATTTNSKAGALVALPWLCLDIVFAMVDRMLPLESLHCKTCCHGPISVWIPDKSPCQPRNNNINGIVLPRQPWPWTVNSAKARVETCAKKCTIKAAKGAVE